MKFPKYWTPPPPTPPKVATLESSGFLKVRRRSRSIHGQNSQRDRENRIRVGPIITCSRRSDFEMAHRCEREKQRKVRRGGLLLFFFLALWCDCVPLHPLFKTILIIFINVFVEETSSPVAHPPARWAIRKRKNTSSERLINFYRIAFNVAVCVN